MNYYSDRYPKEVFQNASFLLTIADPYSIHLLPNIRLKPKTATRTMHTYAKACNSAVQSQLEQKHFILAGTFSSAKA